MTEAQFKEQAAAQGFGEVKDANFAANLSTDMHTHEFTALVMVTEGAVTLAYEDGPKTYAAGDVWTVEAGTLHAEQVGPLGAKGLAARK